ncbi:hypothetical protein MC885_010084, partial [Smutsia gigantea]
LAAEDDCGRPQSARAGAAQEQKGGLGGRALALPTRGWELLLNVALVALVRWGPPAVGAMGAAGFRAGGGAGEESPAASLPRMKKRSFSLEQPRQYHGSPHPAHPARGFKMRKALPYSGPKDPSCNHHHSQRAF